MTDQEFKNQVVLITGAGKGAGRALALAFAGQGAIVAANDVSPNNLSTLVTEIQAQGGQAKAYVEDVAKKVGAQALVKDVEEDFGHIDVLVNHASAEPQAALLEMDEWDWQRTLNVNLTGAFLMTQSAARMMKTRGQGVIVNLITEAGLVKGPDRGAFLASMAGLKIFSQQAAQELAPDGIHVFSAQTDTPVETILKLCKSVF
jgi:NAD(P)-dependent dehydrogenase (short-subunit alcohol dehydrogenase family)